jgi:hypothetical protein
MVMTCAINVPQKATNDYTRKAQKDNFQLPACLLVRPHWPLRTSVDLVESSNPARCTYFLIAGRVLMMISKD